jgi:acyl-CoA dehydrogenase
MDTLRPVARANLAGAPGRLLVDPARTPGALADIDRRGGALLGSEAVGVGARALDLAVRHALDRVQFGRPIGSYQAVAHQLADSYAAIELARSLAYRALCVLDTTPDEAAEALATAAVATRRAALTACQSAIQVAGGMGVSWEHPLHRWYRRALWLDQADAGPDRHLDTLAAVVFDSAAAFAPVLER